MKALIVLFSLGIIVFSCESNQYLVTEADNPVFKSNQAFQSMEDLTNPGFSHLKEKYQIDTILSWNSLRDYYRFSRCY